MTTGNGVTTETTLDPIEDGEEAFLAHYLKHHPEDEDASKKKPSDKASTASKGDTKHEVKDDGKSAEETSEEALEETEEEETVEKKAKKYVEEDGETYTKIKVGEEEHEVPVSQLKRLFGQEASLTQKSQAVAAQQKLVEADSAKYAASLTALLTRAEERWEPFAKLDFLVLAKDPSITAEQLSELRNEAQTRYEEVNFLKSEQGNLVTAIQKTQHENLVTQAKAAVKTLSDPESPHHIEGWDQKVYDGIRNFAITAGLDQEVVNNLVDAPSLKILHDAMKYREGLKKVTTQVVNKTVKKVIKTSKTVDGSKHSGKANETTAMAKLKASGSQEDAADAFLARMTKNDD
jgi:hypothetical protein